MDETQGAMAGILERLGGVADAITVRRVFGEAYEVDGITIIPVASVRGGGGGGGGEGTGPNEMSEGSGGGMGFGVQARPVGVYEVRGGVVTWKPAIDVMRLAIGAQVLVALFLLMRRRRPT